MSEPTQSPITPEAGENTGFGPVRRKPNIATRVTAEEVRLLIDLGKSSNLSLFAGIIVVTLVFWQTAPIWAGAVVFALQLTAQLYFNYVRAGFNADPDAVPNALQWAKRYTVGTFLSGLTWGVGGLLWLPGASFPQHVFYALVLASLSVATVITRATFPPAIVTYVATAVTPTVVLMLLDPDPLNLATVALGLLFLLTLVGWTRRIGRAYREAFHLRYENADLVERMARAHAATEQKRADAEMAEHRAKAANRAKGEFLDILGREVSAPLENLAQMARQLHDEPLSDIQRNLADAMSFSSKKLSRLFGDMIDFSQMEAQTLELRPERFDPIDLAKSIVREMRPLAASRRLSLELDVAPGTVSSMVADSDRLRQVLVNLISNGIKFTETGGVIFRVQMVADEHDVPTMRFSVIDTGIGLTTDARTRLFDGFAKGGAGSQTSGSGGMGLGLAVADRLVRLMGGEIEVDSASGQGSTFWFLLPVEMPVTRPLSRAADKAASGPHATLQRTTSRLIDHDYLYELERDMGPDDASDRMVDALTNILSLYEGIAKAGNEGDHENLADQARTLQAAADAIGLVAIAEAARSIELVAVEARADEVQRLRQRITETWGQLARTYPGLNMSLPDQP
tara:strand:- start:12940 stop:14817 length:1878 start_codon:yes stop_codon:yes gene_type:complete